MAKISKTSSYEFYHCTNCKELTPSIMVIEYEAKTSEVMKVLFIEDKERNGEFFQTDECVHDDINNLINIKKYKVKLKLCRYCGSTVEVVPDKIAKDVFGVSNE